MPNYSLEPGKLYKLKGKKGFYFLERAAEAKKNDPDGLFSMKFVAFPENAVFLALNYDMIFNIYHFLGPDGHKYHIYDTSELIKLFEKVSTK